MLHEQNIFIWKKINCDPNLTITQNLPQNEWHIDLNIKSKIKNENKYKLPEDTITFPKEAWETLTLTLWNGVGTK